MVAFSDFKKTVNIPVLKWQPTTTCKIDIWVLVKEDMKKKWDKAKDGKKRTMTLITVNEMVMLVHNQAIDCATGDLVHPVEQYACLLLVGSYSAGVRHTAKVLEETSIAMEKDGIAQKKVQKVRQSLGHMNLELMTLNPGVQHDSRWALRQLSHKMSHADV